MSDQPAPPTAAAAATTTNEQGQAPPVADPLAAFSTIPPYRPLVVDGVTFMVRGLMPAEDAERREMMLVVPPERRRTDGVTEYDRNSPKFLADVQAAQRLNSFALVVLGVQGMAEKCAGANLKEKAKFLQARAKSARMIEACANRVAMETEAPEDQANFTGGSGSNGSQS